MSFEETQKMHSAEVQETREVREITTDAQALEAGWFRRWRIPIGLVGLSLIPAAAGSVRVVQLATGVSETADNTRFVHSPMPVVVHVVSVVVFSMLGAFQFAPVLRGRGRSWHQKSGRLIAFCGLVAAASGAWMTRFYDLPVSDNSVLSAFRYAFAAAMGISIVLGVLAIRARDFSRHGAWMTRAYAIGLGAGTQVFTSVAWLIPFGKPALMTRAFLMLAGWLINVAIAERVIRSRSCREPVSGGQNALISISYLF